MTPGTYTEKREATAGKGPLIALDGVLNNVYGMLTVDGAVSYRPARGPTIAANGMVLEPFLDIARSDPPSCLRPAAGSLSHTLHRSRGV